MKLVQKHKNMWEDHITMDLKELGYEDVAAFIWLRIGSNGRFL
jgi:hypothetical protein